MAANKDTAEVIKFLALFAKPKDRTGDEPEMLPDLAKSDEAIKEICDQLYWTASFLKMNERRHRQLFAVAVDPKFLIGWRDFEEHFEPVLADILFTDIFRDLDAAEPTQASKADLQWETADDEAVEQARAIEGAIDFAHDQATQDGPDFDEGGKFRESIEDGMAAWERLKREAAFDLRGVFRRRELIPFARVPRHVAAKHGSAEKLSMFEHLRQAHDAFIFGAPFAALGLMRSIMEAVLRDHYGAPETNLEKHINLERRINNAGGLPPGANRAALHRLRDLANTILHLKDKDEGLPKIERGRLEKEPPRLEKEIVSLLYVLRALIEGAPQARS